MTNEQVKEIKVGDRILFTALTRWSCSPAWRQVKKVNPPRKHQPVNPLCSENLPEREDATVEVRFGGWGHFIVNAYEIHKVEPKTK